MRVEVMAGTKNVLRFPVERRARPTLDLLYEIAPDDRVVGNVANAFSLDMAPPDYRDLADADAAEYIARQLPVAGPVRESMLGELLAPVVAEAVAACRAAYDAASVADDAEQRYLAAQVAGGFWLDPLRGRISELGLAMAELLVTAHARSEAAMGVGRAVEMARAGEAWSPRSIRKLEEEVFGYRQVG